MADLFVPSIDGVKFGDHTADIWLEVEGASPEECSYRALQGLYSIMAQEFLISPGIKEEMVLNMEKEELLLNDVISEALFLFDSEGCLILGPHLSRTEEGLWRMEYIKSPCTIPEGKAGMEVKAATYHGRGLERAGEVWKGRLLLDI